MKITLIIFCIIFLIMLLCLIVAYILFYKVVHPSGSQRPTYEQSREWITNCFNGDFLSWYDKAPKEEFKIVSGKSTLSCVYIPPNKNSGIHKKCIISIHGYAQNMMLSAAYSRSFYENGYAVVIFDQRSFGNSKGGQVTFGVEESKDVLEIIKWVRNRLGDDCFIGIRGESLGAITVLYAAAQDSGLGFVIADSAVSDVMHEINNSDFMHIPKPVNILIKITGKIIGTDICNIKPIKQLDKITAPILFVHGEKDTTISKRSSEEMYSLANGRPWKLIIYPDVAHVLAFPVYGEKYEKDVMDFADFSESIWSDSK